MIFCKKIEFFFVFNIIIIVIFATFLINMNNFENFLHTILGNYISDPKWYPFILIGIGILGILIIFVIFLYIRSFLSWIVGNNEIIRLQKEQNELLNELIAIQDEQRELMEALFVENVAEENTEIFDENDEDFPENDENESIDLGKNPKIPEEKYQNKVAKKKWFSKK